MLEVHSFNHGLRTPREEIAFTARPKIQSQSQIFRYGQVCHIGPIFSDIFDLCLHWASVVHVLDQLGGKLLCSEIINLGLGWADFHKNENIKNNYH